MTLEPDKDIEELVILTVATNRDRLRCLVSASLLGIVFAYGFLPTAADLGNFIFDHLPRTSLPRSAGVYLGFPLLAGFFALSLPTPTQASDVFAPYCGLRSLILPILIAATYGILHPAPGLLQAHTLGAVLPFVWITFCVPLAEEWLFRGWTYNLFERIWPGKIFTQTNPLPMGVWASAVAFSLWHLQNLSSQSLGWTLFQCLYTLGLGLWLGALRAWSGKLRGPVLAHALINAASAL